MSETYIEVAGNIIVHHPVKVETTKYEDWTGDRRDVAIAA